MTKAKLKVTDRAVSDLGTVIHSTVELLDADGTMVEYGIKEYHDDHQGKIIDVEIENMTNGRDVGENSVLGKRIMEEVDKYDNAFSYANDPNLEVQMNQDEISVSEKVNHFLAELGINDDEFEDHIHTLIVHHKHVQVDIPCSAELDNEMYNESI